MRMLALADLHGHLPVVPKVDVICIAGDICPDGTVLEQHDWLDKEFRPWLEDHVGGAKVFATWGNHDWVGETNLVPKELRWDLLVNRTAQYEGLKFSGFPWTTVSTRWAFHKPRAACESYAAQFYHELETDVLLNHTPPYSIGDLCPDGERVGSVELQRFLSRGNPKICVTGHIHEGRSIYALPDGGLVLHASYLDGQYHKYSNDPMIVEVL
jgi:Icc-related predicted phosphoesterase